MDFNRKISAYPQKLSETQLHTVNIARDLSRHPLGFIRSLVDVWCMAEVLFFYDLDGLGGIHSTWGKSAEIPKQTPQAKTPTMLLFFTGKW